MAGLLFARVTPASMTHLPTQRECDLPDADTLPCMLVWLSTEGVVLRGNKAFADFCSVSLGQVTALDGADFELRAGEILAVIGATPETADVIAERLAAVFDLGKDVDAATEIISARLEEMASLGMLGRHNA